MAHISEDIINRVIEKIDIAQLISEYIPLKRAGRNFRACCPFHQEKTPSFFVTPDKQIFHCFGCGEGGNALSFVMKQERMTFPEAVRFLADKVGIEIPEDSPEERGQDNLRQSVFKANEAAVEYFSQNILQEDVLEVKEAQGYLKKRNITRKFAKRFFIGYAYDSWDVLIKYLKKKSLSDVLIEKSGLVVRSEKGSVYDRFRGRVIFSIFDHRDRPVAFGARTMKKEDKAKYINSPETPVYTKGQYLYGLNWAKDAVIKEDQIIIVEGYLDCLRPMEQGVENIVASLGTALTIEQIRLIRRYTKNVVMLFDMDMAGQEAVLRSLDDLLAEDMVVKVARLPQGEDPDSFVLRYGIDAFRQNIAEARSLFDFKLELLMGRYNADSMEGRGQVAQEMLHTIDKIPNEVVRDGYRRQLAQRFHVSVEALLKEAKRIRQPEMTKAVSRHQKTIAVHKPTSDKETCLLRLVLQDEKWLRRAYQELKPQDFKDPMVKLIMGKIFALIKNQKNVQTANLVNCFEDEKVRSFLTASLQEDEAYSQNQERIFQQCLTNIKKTQNKVTRQQILKDMRDAESVGDEQRLRLLQEEFNKLIKR